MTVSISAGNGAGSTAPMMILSPWETTFQSRNIIHDLIGGGIAVSLVAPRPRSGTMELLYQTEALAFASATLHQEETTFTLIDSQTTNASMTYVIDGEVRVRLDEDTLTMWIVSVGYQAVIP